MSSTVSDSLDVYEDNLNDETMLDCSSQQLEAVPNIENEFISILYLQNNHISSLPQNFFPSLPNLKWLDLRDNKLADIPSSIQAHPSLTHLLLQNNKLTSLPNELGTVATLKVLQIRGNPLTYPSKDVIKGGIKTIKQYLQRKFTEVSLSDVTEDSVSYSEKMTISDGAQSYNSVLEEINKDYRNGGLTVKFNEKELQDHEAKKNLARIIERCPRLYKGTTYCQSAKYLKPIRVGNKDTQVEKLRLSYLKASELKKQKDLLAGREKILQDRKNIALLKNWRKDYRSNQIMKPNLGRYSFDPNNIPYDINPEYLTLLSRDDIEKDLPDKYRKRLIRKCKPSVPRKNISDVKLALKIKELFENLASINLERTNLTPRTEQRMLMNEIQKISEIKMKLNELSLTNANTVGT